MNTTSVDSYLREGCGRCEDYQTPRCKALLWTGPLEALRALVRGAGLQETMKWGSPTYTLGGKNVVMLASFRESCALSFFKGALLTDDDGQLQQAGPNSHHARFLRFTSQREVSARKELIQRLLAQAMELERRGAKVERPKEREPMPAELERRLAAEPKLKRAFEALTPGRQRSHILHVSGARQSETRARRADRCAKDILAGRGFNERDPRAERR
jgi:uncharacterized protein YdeI (YjbR/CyaY-like superfamily)